MWWEWILVGVPVLVSSVYLVRLAWQSTSRVWRGQGCRSMGCGCGGNGPSTEEGHARELLQISVGNGAVDLKESV